MEFEYVSMIIMKISCFNQFGKMKTMIHFLDNAALQFGGLVSSSNTYDNCSEVTIDTDSPVIWTMGIEPLQKHMSNCEILL